MRQLYKSFCDVFLNKMKPIGVWQFIEMFVVTDRSNYDPIPLPYPSGKICSVGKNDFNCYYLFYLAANHFVV